MKGTYVRKWGWVPNFGPNGGEPDNMAMTVDKGPIANSDCPVNKDRDIHLGGPPRFLRNSRPASLRMAQTLELESPSQIVSLEEGTRHTRLSSNQSPRAASCIRRPNKVVVLGALISAEHLREPGSIRPSVAGRCLLRACETPSHHRPGRSGPLGLFICTSTAVTRPSRAKSRSR